MTFKFEEPPAELTGYYLGPLLAADTGTLKYDRDRYRISGVSNNTVACIWAGLLAAYDDGLLLTDLGRRMLADWKASPVGQRRLAEQTDHGEETSVPPAPKATAPQPDPARANQLDLFAPTA